MSSSQQEILFFETIAHDGEIDQVLQVDEIKFDQPVYIDELRILPAGYNVNGLEKSPIRVGATKPMPCELEFYGKNLNARTSRDRVRYRRLGKRVFRDENDMTYLPKLSIPVDSLIVKGKYDTLTIAVIGVLARPKSPPVRHDPPSNNKQIVDYLQSAPHSTRAHPMDTLPLAIVQSPTTTSTTFAVPTHPSSMHENVPSSSSSSAHADGVWVAPPEQPVRQQQQQQPISVNFSHLQSQRATQQRLNDDHSHDYNHPSSSQSVYPPTRLDDRPQSTSSFNPRTATRPNFSPSDFPHGDKSLDEMDEKQTRGSMSLPQYRPNLSDHSEDLNPMISSFSHFPNQNPYLTTNDHHRRIPEIFNSHQSINNTEEILSDGDSYLSDDNTSESEASSVQGILFNEDEQQAFKREALYNTRGSTRLTTLKTFPSPIKSPYEIECDKNQKEKNSEILTNFRQFLSRPSIDHCHLDFLESFESICSIFPTALASLDSAEELTSAIERLKDWSLKLINIEYLMSQQFTNLDENLLKIRILKCGIRLCGHLSVLTEDLSKDWIKSDFQSKLLDLFDDECFSPSVKFLILQILDQTLFFHSGLLWFTGQHADFPLTTRPSPYFRLVEKLQMGNELKQSISSISCLLRKIHFYEELFSLEIQMKNLSTDESSSFTVEQSERRKEIFDDLLVSLSSIRDVLMNSMDLISQSKSSRVAPFQSILSVVFEKLPINENSWPFILRSMISTEFFHSIPVLIHLCILNHRQDLFNVIEEIFREFFNSFDALVFLTNQTTTPNGLLKAFFYAETKFEDVNNDPVGPQLMCAFQTLSYIDELRTFSSNDRLKFDDNELLQVLHYLLSLILFHHYVRKCSNKRRILVRILAMESNFQSLLDLLEPSDRLENIRTRYVARILYEIFATPDSVFLFERYGTRLFNLCEKHSNRRLIRVRQWLTPLSKLVSIDFSQETVDQLINQLKIHLQESNQSGEFSPGLMTILRLIQFLTIPPEQQFVPGAKIELKYDFMLLQFFGQDIYPLLINLLEKCADSLLTSWQIGFPLNIPDRILTYGILIPTLIVFRTLLQKFLCDRKTKFVDMSPIRALFSIYTVTLCASPSTDLTDVEIIRTNLIDSFLAFTWSVSNDVDVENSAWTLVLREMIRLTTRFPYSISSGLCLLTELLPIPLPHNVRQALSLAECQTIKDDFHRYHNVVYYVWTHDPNHQLQKLIQSLCHTSNTIMQEILRRLTMQLIDLGAKMSKILLKTLIDELISTWKNYQNEPTKNSKSAISDVGRLVAFLATLTSIRSGKCAFLSLLNSSDEKYSTIFKDLLEFLHVRAESNEICLCQEATMSIIQTLCDAHLSLSSTENPLQFLGNVLPSEEIISQILTNILRLLSSTKQQPTWTQTTLALRTMVSLAEHDFGLQMIRKALIENNQVFCTLIAGFDLRFDKEQPDYLEAVSSLMVFLQRLMMIEPVVDLPFQRTQFLPPIFFRELLGVSPNNDSQLEKFIDLINAVVSDDSSATHDTEGKQPSATTSDALEQNEDDQQCLQTLQKILERANSIIRILKNSENAPDLDVTTNIHLPKAESIDIQFENRLIYVITPEYTDDQRTSELYWFGIPTPALLDDVDYGQDETTTNPEEINDKVRCDLEEFIGKYCGTFHFVDQYKKEVIDRIRRKRKSSSKKRSVPVEPTANVDTSIITTSASKSRVPWSAPMRGSNRRNLRPGGNTVNLHNPSNGIQRRTDHFRSRPLNTSRPPSMHVDEFEKQFNDHGNGTNTGNSSSNNNNNINENNEGNNGNEMDLINNMTSSSDNNSERERWSRRGATPNFRIGPSSHHRYPFLPNHLGYPGAGFSFRDRLPYNYPPSRYSTIEMDFAPPYFGNDEILDDRPYDYYPMAMPFDPIRYRGHFGRYDPRGFH